MFYFHRTLNKFDAQHVRSRRGPPRIGGLMGSWACSRLRRPLGSASAMRGRSSDSSSAEREDGEAGDAGERHDPAGAQASAGTRLALILCQNGY